VRCAALEGVGQGMTKMTTGMRAGRVGRMVWALAAMGWAAAGCGDASSDATDAAMDAQADAGEMADDTPDVPAAPGVQGARCPLNTRGACAEGLQCMTVTSDTAGVGVCTRTCLPVAASPPCEATGVPGGSYACVLSLTPPTGQRCVARCGSDGAQCPAGTECRGDSNRDGSPDLCLPPPTVGDAGAPPADVPVTPPSFAYLRGVSSLSNAAVRLCLGREFVGEVMRTVAAGTESPSTGFVRIPIGAQRSSIEVQSTRTQCLDITGSRTQWTARAGGSYTVFGGQVSGFIPRLLSDQEPPPTGQVRLRASSRAEGAWGMGVDVCTADGAVALAGITRSDSPTAAIDTPSTGLVARLAATPPCTGTVLGNLPGRALADRAYTLFLVGSDSDSAVLAVWCEDPSPTLDPLSARCVHARLGR